MVRYYLHVHDGSSAPDEEGVELRDVNAARAEAIRASGEILRDCRPETLDGSEWRMTVTDQEGRNVFTLRLSAENT